MKLTILSTLLVSTIALGSVVTVAAETKSYGATAETPAERPTNGIVTFIENEDPVGPVDPIEPENPVTPTDPIDPNTPVKPGTGGPLSLDYASALNFGMHKISTKDETFFANAQHVKNAAGEESFKPLYGQVTDKRGKNQLVGWTLSVNQKEQFKTAKGDVLDGAIITFLKGQTETEKENKPNEPASEGVTKEIALIPGSDHNLLVAKKGQGSGTHIYRMGDMDSIKEHEEKILDKDGAVVDGKVMKDEAVTLFVPGATIKNKDEAYQTTLLWKLSTVAGENEGGEEPGIPGEE